MSDAKSPNEELKSDSSPSNSKRDKTGRESQSQWQLMWKKFNRNRLAQAGSIFIIVLITSCLFAPFFSPYDYRRQNLSESYVPPQKLRFLDQNGNFHLIPFVYQYNREIDPETYEKVWKLDKSEKFKLQLLAHSWDYSLFGFINADLHLFGVEEGGSVYLLGTDFFGRDLLSCLIFGGRISVSIAVLGTFVTGLIGSLLGAISGYFSGLTDIVIQRVVELIRVFPKLPLWMALTLAFPPTFPNIYILYGMIIIFACLSWPLLAREVRGKVLTYREEEFVMAAKSVGASNNRIILRHIIPQSISHIIVVLTLTIPRLILAESMLSFLGLGIQPPMVSWGVLLKRAQNFHVLKFQPWILFSGVAILITVLSFNFIGDGLRDAADPFSE